MEMISWNKQVHFIQGVSCVDLMTSCTHLTPLTTTEATPTHQQLGVAASSVRQPVHADNEREEGRGAGDYFTAVQCHGEPAQHFYHQQIEGGDAQAAGDEGG